MFFLQLASVGDLPEFVAAELTRLGFAGAGIWYFYNRAEKSDEKYRVDMKSKDDEIEKLRKEKDESLDALREKLDEKVRECHEREVQLIQARRNKL